LELSSCYEVYKAYCASIKITAIDYKTFLLECEKIYPRCFKQRKITNKYIPPMYFLQGLTYVHPTPFKETEKGIRYYIKKTTTGNIGIISRQLSDDDRPKGIPDYWPDFARLCQIKSGNKLVPFTAFDYQVKVYELMCKYTKLSIVKSRQLGLTQVMISIFLHRACLNPAYTAAIFLRNKQDTTKIADRNRQMVESLSAYITNKSDSANLFRIKGGGDIHFMNAGPQGARGMDSVSDILLDEAAFNDNIQSIVAASGAAQAMVEGESTRVVISTPNTKYGWFWDEMSEHNPDGFDFSLTCEQVVAQQLPSFYTWVDKRDVCKIIIHWRAHPLYSKHENYVTFRQIEDGSTREEAEREYNLSFINSDVSIFDINDIIACMDGAFETEYDPLFNYYMGIDTSGTGDDFTVAWVIKQYKIESPSGQRNAYRVVDVYRKSHTINDIDMIGICDLINKWHPQKIGVEIVEGTGSITFQKLIQIYPDIVIQGIRTSDQNKPIMVAVLLTLLQERRMHYPKGAFAEELAIFSNIDGKMKAPANKHDDTVMAMLMALAVAPVNEGDYRIVSPLQGIEDAREPRELQAI
jgi:hypothetical protein